MKFWYIFFGAISFIIVSTMMIPSVFGLQSFTQWGGMYTDSWCNATVYSGHPEDPGVQSKWFTVAKDQTTVAVWSSPMHNQTTCAMWFREVLCGRTVPEGWKVVWVKPNYKHQEYMGDNNACDIKLELHAPWFRNAQEI